MGEIDQAHAGAKSTKLSFLGGFDRLCSVGFTKQSQRQIKFWDVKKLGGEPVHQIQLDQASGVIIPYYDVDTRVLYLAGKGDGNIRYYENIAEKPWAFALSEYRSTQAAKGTCFVPKRGLDVMRCETARCLKLVSQAGKGSVEPLSFIVPRKSDAFQDDIFPDAFCGAPSMTADEWWAGANIPPEPRRSTRPRRAMGHQRSPRRSRKSKRRRMLQKGWTRREDRQIREEAGRRGALGGSSCSRSVVVADNALLPPPWCVSPDVLGGGAAVVTFRLSWIVPSLVRCNQHPR